MSILPHHIGRLLFAFPFGVFAAMNFIVVFQVMPISPTFLPVHSSVALYLIGIAMTIAFLSIISEKYVRPVCYGLAILFLALILTVHIPALRTADGQAAMINLLRDTALMGLAITYAVIYAQKQETHSTYETIKEQAA